MTTAATPVPVEETEANTPEPEPPVSDAEAEAQFLAGVQSALPEPTAQPPATDQAAVEVPPADTTTAASADEAAPAVTPADQPAAQTPEPPKVPKYVQVTEEELTALKSNAAQIAEIKATMEQRFGTAFGKLGGVERKLREVAEATPAGQKVEITDEDLADMVAEFGPEFTGTMKKTFAKVVDKLVGTLRPGKPAAPSAEPAPAPAQSQPAAEPASPSQPVNMAELEARITMNTLRPNWRRIVGTPNQETPFRTWLATQPQEVRDRLDEGWDAVYLNEQIDAFEKETAPPATPATAPGSPRPPAVDPQRRRLQSAVQPRGVGTAPEGTTDQDDFMAGFNKVKQTWAT